MGDGVLLAEIFEQRSERGQPVADRRAAEFAQAQLVAPGDQVRARHGAEFLRAQNASETHEVRHRVLVGATGVVVADVGEPLDPSNRCAGGPDHAPPETAVLNSGWALIIESEDCQKQV